LTHNFFSLVYVELLKVAQGRLNGKQLKIRGEKVLNTLTEKR
jgi:hypothetical protein